MVTDPTVVLAKFKSTPCFLREIAIFGDYRDESPTPHPALLGIEVMQIGCLNDGFVLNTW